MTFLFLETVTEHCNTIDLSLSNTTTIQLTRTGQAVTLLNLSFYEPETCFKCLNEVLYLLTLPALDDFFRDRNTGKLKKEWTFVVDNGPAEQPSSPMVRMCLARMVNFLKLQRITQVSFAEYHSKRNYVESVHAEENRVLSKHGPFNSTVAYPIASPGSKEHHINMERMADDVRQCISHGSFGSKPLLAYRGIKLEDFVFTDEKVLQTFLSLNEEGKMQFALSKYAATAGEILDVLHFCWEVDEHFQGDYIRDYKTLHNNLSEDVTQPGLTSIPLLCDITCRRYELQPIPDYLRWFKTGELHYLPLEERAILSGAWDDIPEVLLPSKVLDLYFAIVDQPSDDIVRQISLLSWTTPSEVKQYYKNIQIEIESQVKSEREKERWKSHPLYKENTKVKLEAQCRSIKIPVTAALHKHELVSLICERKGEPSPPASQLLYSGSLSSVPGTASGLQRYTIPKLKNILKCHNIPPIGGKDELVLKVLLLR